MHFRKGFIGLLLLLNGCGSSAYHLREGIKAFQVQNYRQAFIRLKPVADKGQPDAAYAVGYMYYYGQGVVEDRKKAWEWIRCAARAGQPDAIAAIKILEAKRPSDLESMG
jgi:TPR repeat protein